jgi:hypothetical protein
MAEQHAAVRVEASRARAAAARPIPVAARPSLRQRLTWALSRQRRAERILDLGLFDPEWYAASYPDAPKGPLDAVVNWLESAWREGHSPTPLFDTRWYLDRYETVADSGRNPLLHYLDRGAVSGYDPNPMFDSNWYLARNSDVASAGINPLVHYLHVGDAEGRDPCPMFDVAWYVEEHGVALRPGSTSLGHYLTLGAPHGCDPNPLFDTTAYMETEGLECDRREAPRHFQDSGLALAPGAYRSTEVLLAHQAAYRGQTRMELHADRRARDRRFAVYFQCGSGSVHERWLSRADRPWDLVVNHYDPRHLGRIPCDVEFRQAGHRPGTKFTSFDTFLREWPEIAARYDFVMLLDDDVLLTEIDVTNLFGIVERHALDLAQPALTPSSFALHDLFYRKGEGLRYVDGVEIMMPVLSRRALRAGGPLFGETISGWGLDTALGKLVTGYLEGRAAVVDDVVVQHTKPVDMREGAYYRMLSQAGIYPWLEARNLRARYGAPYGFRELDH